MIPFIMEFQVLSTISEEDENACKEGFDKHFAEFKAKDRTSFKLLKSFCLERERQFSVKSTIIITNSIGILTKLMHKIANAKAEVRRLMTSREIIMILIQKFHINKFNIRRASDDDDDWVEATPSNCEALITDYIDRTIEVVDKYYITLKKLTVSTDILLNLVTDPTVLPMYMKNCIATVYLQMKELFKTRVISDDPDVEFMTRFSQLYRIDLVVQNLYEKEDSDPL